MRIFLWLLCLLNFCQGQFTQLLNTPEFGESWDFRVGSRSEFFCASSYCNNPFNWTYEGFAIVLNHPFPLNISCSQFLNWSEPVSSFQLILTFAANFPLNFRFFIGNWSIPLNLTPSNVLINQTWNLSNFENDSSFETPVSIGIQLTSLDFTKLVITSLYLFAQTNISNSSNILDPPIFLNVFDTELIDPSEPNLDNNSQTWTIVPIVLGIFTILFFLGALIYFLWQQKRAQKDGHLILEEINPSSQN